jgi:hypothetical protein
MRYEVLKDTTLDGIKVRKGEIVYMAETEAEPLVGSGRLEPQGGAKTIANRDDSDDGDVTVPPGQIAELSPDKAQSLINAGKIEAILSEERRYDSQELAVTMGNDGRLSKEQAPDPFCKLFRNIADEIKRQYIDGTIEYIERHHPDLYRKISGTEEKIDEIWIAGLRGKRLWRSFSRP